MKRLYQLLSGENEEKVTQYLDAVNIEHCRTIDDMVESVVAVCTLYYFESVLNHIVYRFSILAQNKSIPKLCREKNVRLLVIDRFSLRFPTCMEINSGHDFSCSLAGLTRTEFDTTLKKEMSERTLLLFKLARQLKWLADTHDLRVVVVNQVGCSIQS